MTSSITVVLGVPPMPRVEVAYEVTRLLDTGWELSVGGRPIARIQRCAAGWSVNGVFDRMATEVFGTSQAAVDAGTLRY
jgi:hypothetical protein